MKAAEFDYIRPESLADALALMADQTKDVMPLAGGQSLMPMMNFRLATPDLLIDLDGIADLKGTVVTGTNIKIGAMTRYTDLSALPDLHTHLPLVANALPHIAHSAIRNRGTIGGSVALADPAAELPAVLTALDATIHVASQTGTRSIPADTFFQGLYETARDPGELVVAIEIPKAQARDSFAFHELTRRHGDYAMAGVAIAQMSSLRIALFSVSDRPTRVVSAEKILVDDPTALDKACATLDEIDYLGDLNASIDMKRHLAKVALRRAWESFRR